jgi:hypothetical protein
VFTTEDMTEVTFPLACAFIIQVRCCTHEFGQSIERMSERHFRLPLGRLSSLSNTFLHISVTAGTLFHLVQFMTQHCEPRSAVQVALGVPLLQPYKVLQSPSITLYRTLTIGSGIYIGGTITAIALVLFVSSIWEAVSIQKSLSHSDHKYASTQYASRWPGEYQTLTVFQCVRL